MGGVSSAVPLPSRACARARGAEALIPAGSQSSGHVREDCGARFDVAARSGLRTESPLTRGDRPVSITHARRPGEDPVRVVEHGNRATMLLGAGSASATLGMVSSSQRRSPGRGERATEACRRPGGRSIRSSSRHPCFGALGGRSMRKPWGYSKEEVFDRARASPRAPFDHLPIVGQLKWLTPQTTD